MPRPFFTDYFAEAHQVFCDRFCKYLPVFATFYFTCADGWLQQRVFSDVLIDLFSICAVRLCWLSVLGTGLYASDLLRYVAICHQEVDFCHQLPNFLSFALHDWSLSITTHSLLLNRDSGTVYLKTFCLPHHWQYSAKNWNFTYFDIHTRTLFCRTRSP